MEELEELGFTSRHIFSGRQEECAPALQVKIAFPEIGTAFAPVVATLEHLVAIVCFSCRTGCIGRQGSFLAESQLHRYAKHNTRQREDTR
ncbi:hypothetical protein STEG23_035630 [Scotinomys teguina]